jgi:hypothetical protein
MTREAKPGLEVGFIVGSQQRSYLRPGMIRFLSSLFVALALFWSPLAMVSGAGMAMSHPSATAASDTGGHCTENEAPSGEESAPSELSCASACAAFLPCGPTTANEAPTAQAVLTLLGPQLLAGIHPEWETPPPRMTSEI